MSKDTEHLLKEILHNQQETQRLVKFLAHREASAIINEHLPKSIERRVYELSDGLRSSRDIEKMIGKEVTQRTVVTWWQRWKELGVMEQSPTYSGRVRKLIPLDDLGIPIQGEDE